MRKFFKKIRYFIEYLIVILVNKFLLMLGLDRASNLCGKLAQKIGPYLSVNKIAKQNIAATLGDTSILSNVWNNFGRFIGEFPYTQIISEDEVNKRITIEGMENIQDFQKSSKPFIIFTGHFANWDFVIRITSKLYHKFGIIYRKANNPYFDKIVHTARNSSDGVQMIAKGSSGVRNLLKCIKSGASLVMLVDQKMNDGIEVPFFGKPAMTAHAIAKLSLQHGYPIIPLQIIRTKGCYFRIVIHPAIDFKATQNQEQDCYNIMCKINLLIEKWIRQNPSQWFWFHNRWKK